MLFMCDLMNLALQKILGWCLESICTDIIAHAVSQAVLTTCV